LPIVVHQARLDRDRQVLIDFLRQHLTPLSDERRFNWLYQENPAGPAQAWLAWDTATEKLIGVAAAFPRLMQVDGNTTSCYVLGDFCIDGGHRSLGPALQLQRACLARVHSGEIPFCYDFPSQSMMAVYRRLGTSAAGNMLRFSKPLRVDRKVTRMIGPGNLSKGVSAIANRLLAFKPRGRRRPGSCEITILAGRFGDEFSDLDQRVTSSYRLCGRRTAEYLNWRYRDHPLSLHEAVTARRNGELQGYAVFAQQGEDALLADVACAAGTEVIEDVLEGVAELLRKREIHGISAPVWDSSPLIPALRQAGYYARESTPMVVYARSNSPFEEALAAKKNWYLTNGDRDL
jgi:Acetyltransferase (GNAT) domain